jgi:hypothetical protein
MESVNATRFINGINRLPKQTIAQHVQLTIWKTINTCQECHFVSVFFNKYIATASFPSIELMDEQDKSHAQALRYPVKNPAFRPLLRLKTEDQ